MAWKYVVIRVDNTEYPIIFPDKLVHKEVAEVVSMICPKGKLSVVSAGRIEHVSPDGVGGESETLGMRSRPQDLAMMETYSLHPRDSLVAVYLLHIDPPLRHSRHYVGYSSPKNLYERIRRHKNGTGGVLPRYVVAAGGTISVALVWPLGDREFEKYVKSHGGATRYCPLCCVNTRAVPKQRSTN